MQDRIPGDGTPEALTLTLRGEIGRCPFQTQPKTLSTTVTVSRRNKSSDRSERLGSNFLGIGDAVIVTDPLGKIILLNHAAESLTGWADCDAKDQPIESVFRIIHEVTRQPVIQPVKRVIEHGIIQHLAQFTLLIAKDGVERAIDDSAAPIRDAGGNLDGVVLIFKDISDRRRLEKGLEETRLQGEVIIASVRDSLVVLDVDLRVRSANRSFYETFRTSPSETIGRSLFELGDGQWNIDRFRAVLEDMLTRDKPLDEFEVEWVFPAIGPRTMLLNARRLYRAEGREAMILLVIEDITDRRWTEHSLAASELRFRRLFEAAKDGILILDFDSGAITDANPFVLELLGYSHVELVGKRLWEIGLLGDEEASRASFRELQEKGYVRYEDQPLKTRDGRQIDVEFISNVYRAGDTRSSSATSATSPNASGPKSCWRTGRRNWSAPIESWSSSPTSPRTISRSRCAWSAASPSCWRSATRASSTRRPISTSRCRRRAPSACSS